MALRRPRQQPVGVGYPEIPYDRSGVMDLPQPGGAMKKMSFEFNDPAAQAAPQIPAGAGAPPAGAQGAVLPAGLGGGTPQDANGSVFGALSQPAGGMAGGMDSSMLTDADLAAMADDPTSTLGDQMYDTAMNPEDPASQMVQLQLMEAARRRIGAF